MNARVLPSKIAGTLTAPPSKSYAHRLLIGAFLSGERVKIDGVGHAEDVQTTIACLEALGAQTERQGDSVFLCGKARTSGVLDCRESGSTLRFLLPVAAALGLNATFGGNERLWQRPLKPLLSALQAHGVQMQDKKLLGTLTGGRYELNASVSSQFISGLLLALPLLKEDSELVLQGKMVSEPYVMLTLDVLKRFSVCVERRENGFWIAGGQRYVAPKKISVGGDWSGAAFPLTAAAIGGEVTVAGLSDDGQGDRKILEILRAFGAETRCDDGLVRVRKKDLFGIEWDCEDIPDLVPALAVAAAYAKGETVLKNVARLAQKESDRIAGIIRNLTVAGISVSYDGSDLKISGGRPQGGVFFGDNDHRTAMAAIVLASFADGPSTVCGVEAMKKSYPDFLNDYASIGGCVYGEMAR